MDKKFQHIVGKIETDQPAIIRLFGEITEYNAWSFKSEFEWLENYVKPSKISIHINSEGGSCLHGFSIFSIIQNSEIPTECVNVGLAASIASVIWTAGKTTKMNDYALLMIHPPRYTDKDDLSEDEKVAINSFRNSISIIYEKRLGFSPEKVKEIMDGKDNLDGTFFTAKEAVKSGLIAKDDVIKTSKIESEKISALLKDVKNQSDIQSLLSDFITSNDVKNQDNSNESIINKSQSEIKTEIKMEEKDLNLIVNSLGLKDGSGLADVMAALPNLVKAKNDLADLQSKYQALEIEAKGNKTAFDNANTELTNVKAALNTYQDAEKEAKRLKIETIVNDAVVSGKIKAETKAEWIELANSNLSAVEATLSGIPAVTNIVNEINSDPSNLEALKDADAKKKAEIKAKFGNHEFKTLN